MQTIALSKSFSSGSAQLSVPFLARRGSGSVLRRLTCAPGDAPCAGIASLVSARSQSSLNLWVLGADEVCTLAMQQLGDKRVFWRVSSISKKERIWSKKNTPPHALSKRSY